MSRSINGIDMNRRISMKDHLSGVRKPLIAALALGALGLAGQGFAQSTSSDQSGASTTTRPPAAAGTGAGAGTTAPSGQSTNPSGTGSMSSAKAIPPSKSETSDSAFKKLDASSKGYVTRDDAKSVEGFDRSFQSADANHDGKLTSDEFKKAWTSFTGNPQ
jgi:hypothetical protein